MLEEIVKTGVERNLDYIAYFKDWCKRVGLILA
jgi:hypothetical protein